MSKQANPTVILGPDPKYAKMRDNRFRPVSTPKPKRLTPAQISSYNENGYLKPFRIFDQDGVEKNNRYLKFLLDAIEKADDGRNSFSICGYEKQCRGLYDFATNPTLLDYVEDIVGPNIICWLTHYFCKMPREPRTVPWHQDAAYWPLSHSGVVTAWLAIDDVDIENACMEVIPGTHRLGHLPWKQTDQRAAIHQEVMDAEQYGRPVPIELKAGEMSLHADMLVHGSKANHSSRRRAGLTMRYCSPEITPLVEEWGHGAILCRGLAANNKWRIIPRPPGEDTSPPPYQLQTG